MNLQLALDRLEWGECLTILREVKDEVDWIEVGTGVIKEYGMSIIKEIKSLYPEKVLVADMKTCDAGRHETEQAFHAGADITTVMAFAADRTIVESLDVARSLKKKVMIDLLGVQTKARVEELVRLGVELVSVHFGKDMQLEGQFSPACFDLVKEYPQLDVAVAGGINEESLPSILAYAPKVCIIGSAISGAPNRKKAAQALKSMMV